MESEYRCFFFGNFYFSSIQQGIQAQHCQRRMAVKYFLDKPDTPERKLYEEYARHHETVVLKNGGDDDAMQDVLTLMHHAQNELPWDFFIEPGAGEALTTIGVVVPSRIYEDVVTHIKNSYRKKVFAQYESGLGLWTVSECVYLGGKPTPGNTIEQYSDFEWQLANLIKDTHLAR